MMAGLVEPSFYSVAVVIPCYNVKRHILKVIEAIGPEVQKIYVVDDFCPEETGLFVENECQDRRVEVIYHKLNTGVGGASLTGFVKAYLDKYQIIVKIDGDEQMDPKLIPHFLYPIQAGHADFTKGNRFFSPEDLIEMPKIRLIGNCALSFLTKLSCGYWSIMDPTNGFIAIHRKVFGILPLEKIHKRFFFETDLLFRLNCVRARVKDVPMPSKYGDEVSNLKIKKIFLIFFIKHIECFCKRVLYSYYLRDFNLASILLFFGLLSGTLGVCFGSWQWLIHNFSREATPAGTVMLASLPILFSFQLILFAINYDIINEPQNCIANYLRDSDRQLYYDFSEKKTIFCRSSSQQKIVDSYS